MKKNKEVEEEDKKVRCWWIFNHKWDMWQEYNRGVWTIWYKRSCRKCGKIQVKETNPK